jgi:hypothetical protein
VYRSNQVSGNSFQEPLQNRDREERRTRRSLRAASAIPGKYHSQMHLPIFPLP